MKHEIIQQHLNSILDNMASINQRVNDMDYLSFEKEEFVREEIYAELQEIGKTAHETLNFSEDISMREELEMLSMLNNTTFNQEMEINHQQIWQIINQQLPVIADVIEHSSEYNLTVDA